MDDQPVSADPDLLATIDLGREQADRRRVAKEELDEAIADIQGLLGHEGFLGASGFATAVTASANVPLIYIAASLRGGTALLVHGPVVLPVDLPLLTEEEVSVLVADYANAKTEWQRNRTVGLAQWRESLDRVCRRLWEVVVEPIRAVVGPARAVLIPCGPLGLVPLHAAWAPVAGSDRRRYLLDDMTISYAPSAHALLAAQQVRDATPGHRLLAVVEPAPVSAVALPLASCEVSAAVGASTDPLVRCGEDATVDELERLLPHVDVLHFAGHCHSNVHRPVSSGLILANDKRLTLARVLEIPMRLRLAILSACDSGVFGERMPDEVIALPTGLLQAGAAGVVAGLWALEDGSAAMVLAEFHRVWRREYSEPADALRAAQRWLRDTTNGEKAAIYEAASTVDGWLAAEAADALYARVAWEDPDERSHAHIDSWAGMVFVGV
ncbi:CHAT domain-containing protein [Streptacidiphilus anmyonensis]|uniref:CHAT domain-containing protein n=1 Tax=Streptacidiphilus anmyonensis TaxID=405782 RepID=UPI0005A734B3|nr:CHAT domain-containing protein [Streptacidiphilus anmyonensis]